MDDLNGYNNLQADIQFHKSVCQTLQDIENVKKWVQLEKIEYFHIQSFFIYFYLHWCRNNKERDEQKHDKIW